MQGDTLCRSSNRRTSNFVHLLTLSPRENNMICSQKVERLVLRIQKNKVTCLLLKESTQMIARSNKSFWRT